MVKVCTTELKTDSACFSEPVGLSAEEIGRLGIDGLSFAEQVSGDVDGDGLKDKFQSFLCHGIQFQNGRWSLAHFLDAIKLDLKTAQNAKGCGLALKDADGDGKTDLIFKDLASGAVWVYYNLNEGVPPPKRPALVHVENDSNSGRTTMALERYSYGPSFEIDGVVRHLSFHPVDAAYIQVDGGGLKKIEKGSRVHVENPVGPLSLGKTIRVDFFDERKKRIGSFHVRQHEPAVLKATSGAGITFTIYYPPNRETDKGDLDRFLAATSLVDQRVVELKRLWGDGVVRKAVREVVLDTGTFGDEASAPSQYIRAGTVYISESQSQSVDAEGLSRVIAHEVSHNIERLFTKPDDSLLASVFSELGKSSSPVFEFIADGNFFGDSDGGHPRDNGGRELFASTTSALSAGPEVFSAALDRWDVSRGDAAGDRLRSDLSRLIVAYGDVLRRHGPKGSSARLEPFRAMCSPKTRKR